METGQLVFWQVESASQPGARAWLLGSVHAATPDLVFDDAIESAFAGSDALVIEADITAQGADSFAFVERTLQMALLPDGQTLDQVLTPPVWERLGEFLREHGQPVEPYRRFEPWLVMTMVTSYLFAEAGLPAEGGVDLASTLGPRQAPRPDRRRSRRRSRSSRCSTRCRSTSRRACWPT